MPDLALQLLVLQPKRRPRRVQLRLSPRSRSTLPISRRTMGLRSDQADWLYDVAHRAETTHSPRGLALESPSQAPIRKARRRRQQALAVRGRRAIHRGRRGAEHAEINEANFKVRARRARW